MIAGLGSGCRTGAAAIAAPAPVVAQARPAARPSLPPSAGSNQVRTGPPHQAAAGAPVARPAARAGTAPVSGASEDATGQLIQSIEAQYSAAKHLYHLGQLDEARAGFDATLDRLMATNRSIPASPRLQHELNSLLDRIQALESDELPSGGLTSAKPQPTPLDRIPDLTFPLDAATRAKIERDTRNALAAGRQATLPLTVNDEVMRYIHYFTTTGRSDFISGYRRSGLYRTMADRIFRQVGVPENLLYLAQLESGFDPRLVSSAGARGMWQFMAARSDGYGLKRTHWVDERLNPEKSTRAAAEHLRDLHAEFGDWYLAMAAYNAGPLPVLRAVERTGYADFWKLSALGELPRTVRAYVPVILATALLANHPEQYGFTGLVRDTPVAVDVEPLKLGLDLRLAADCAGVTLGDLQRLNPSLLHYLAPAGFDLKLPQGTGKRFQEGLRQIPDSGRVSWRLHWVQAGENWAKLARRFHISAARLARANHLSTTRPPLAGTPVALPHPSLPGWRKLTLPAGGVKKR